MDRREWTKDKAMPTDPDNARLADELEAVMRGVAPRPPADEAISLDWRLCDHILSALRFDHSSEARNMVLLPNESHATEAIIATGLLDGDEARDAARAVLSTLAGEGE